VKAIRFYQDPGHAWIAVPSEALALVGLSKRLHSVFTSVSHRHDAVPGRRLRRDQVCGGFRTQVWVQALLA
jgi:hypothetical protein